jgi:hypothetical protein
LSALFPSEFRCAWWNVNSPHLVERRLGSVSPELALAEEHVALARQHVARQKALIAELERDGHPTELALQLLGVFEETLAAHLHHRDHLRAAAR